MKRLTSVVICPFVFWVFSALVLFIVSACEQSDKQLIPTTNQTTITALVWAPDWAEEMLKIAAEFNKLNPDIRVNLQFMVGNSVEENLKPRIASGHLPDIVSINPNPYASKLAEEGILVSVTNTAAWANILDGLKADWMTNQKKPFGIAGGVATTLIYYNKNMFSKAGIEKLPSNFEEFLVVCEQLKKAGFTPIIWNGGFPNMLGNGPFSFGFANTIVAEQPDWKSKMAKGTLDLNTKNVAEIFTKIRVIADRGYVQENYMNTGYDEGIRLFTEGKAAMAFHGSWAAGLMMHGKDFETGILIPPWNAPGNTIVPVIGSETGFAVCDTPNKDAALKFIDFIFAQGFAIQQNKRHNISPLKNNIASITSDPQITAYTKTVSNYPITAPPYYAFLPTNTIELLHPLLQDVLTKKKSPAQAAKMLDASIKKEAEMNYK